MESTKIGAFLKESRVPGSPGNIARKITVKLYGKGVFAKQENRPGSENTMYYARRAGQFIYSKLDFLNGAFGIIPDNLDGFETTVDLPCFDFVGDRVAPDWFLQYVSRPDFYAYQGGLGNGGRKARRISPDDFLELEIDLPPLPEQKKIAEILSGIDHAIQKNTLLLNKVLAGKQGLVKDIFERVQINSEAIPLDELLERPLAYGVLKPGPSISDGVQLVKIQDYKNGRINTKNLHRISKELHHEFRRTELKGGEIILSVVGTIGRVAVVPKELAGANVSRAFAVVACHGNINNQYLAHFLDSNRIQQWFKDQCQGNAQQVLNLGTLRELLVPVPSKEEQKEVGLSINSIDTSIAHNRKVITQLHMLKNALASDLLSGRKRVSV